MKFLRCLQPVLLRETLRKKNDIGKRHHSSFQKALGQVFTVKSCRVIAQNMNQGLA